MIDTAALTDQYALETASLRLIQLGPEHFDSTWPALGDEETNRLTGTHARFTATAVRAHLTGLPGRADRADWAVLRKSDDVHLGEAVLNDLDEPNESMNFRISLFGPDALGHGYGTETTRAVRDYGLDVVGLHRISLEVYAFNPRARRVYEKVGFRPEGVLRDALSWEGERHDAIVMSILASDPRP